MVAAAPLLRGDREALLADIHHLRLQRTLVGNGEIGRALGLEGVEPGVERGVWHLAQDGATCRGVEGGTAQPDGRRQHVWPAMHRMGDHYDVVAIENGGEAGLFGAFGQALAGRLDHSRDHVGAEIGRGQFHDLGREPECPAVAGGEAEAGEGVERAPYAGLGQVGGARHVAERHLAALLAEGADHPQAAREGFEEVRPVAAGRASLRIGCPQSRHLYSPEFRHGPIAAEIAHVLSASTRTVTASPTATARIAGHSALKRRPAASTIRVRRGPRKMPSTTLPGHASLPGAVVSAPPSTMSSGRTTSSTLSPALKARAARQVPRQPAPSTVSSHSSAVVGWLAVTDASMRLGAPKNDATSRLAGRR